ncbi:hypothetical protein RhiirA5_371024 [Rhizophagus irregularis]|uniref:MATA-HMG n=2 Tax=Rhizophagus irregularis TaxID=588596 RepID=A0A1B1EUH4_9GLOM|nr:MATA-HMG [Rhizophagus irregularis]ANQ32484.1 MATA-HMG [Rhizophagus irregularis]PKC14988.1 hypothetical protein RhiirA5_371024 [Rhizophagus irregularis]PKC74647.1 hypothetical protein RhiirA1_449718 [Rhizophagus irregularis]CAB5204449.1 unnamed protein product [Rhizophagus irregularis]
MSQYKSKNNQDTNPSHYEKKLAPDKVDNVTLDFSRINNRCLMIVSLNDGTKFDFPVPTTQEIKDRFFNKKSKTQPDKPARPPNKFIIFRTMLLAAINSSKLQVPTVSGLANEVWKKCNLEIDELFTELSQIAKFEHGELNPGYIYKPNRSKSRITKNKTNTLQKKAYQNLNNSFNPALNNLPSSSSPTTPARTTMYSELNYFYPQVHLRIPSQENFHSDGNSYTIDDSITTTQNIQAIPSYNTHFNSLETINDSYQYSTNKMYFPNDDLSMDQFDTYNTSYDHDVNVLIQSHHSMYYFPTAIGYIDNDYNKYIFNSPTSESDLSSSDVSSFHVEQMQESGCIYYSPDHYAIFSTIV